jgi:hypothetical protein
MPVRLDEDEPDELNMLEVTCFPTLIMSEPLLPLPPPKLVPPELPPVIPALLRLLVPNVIAGSAAPEKTLPPFCWVGPLAPSEMFSHPMPARTATARHGPRSRDMALLLRNATDGYSLYRNVGRQCCQSI